MGDDKFMGKYRIPSARLVGWDYGSHGLYFVTICTAQRLHYFGEIGLPSAVAKVAHDCWMAIPAHHPFVELDEFVVMPNHVHGILFINKDSEIQKWEPNHFGPQKRNLPDVMRSYKSSVTREAKKSGLEFGWQTRYHDHIIRHETELNNIRAYIVNNPSTWLEDSNNLNR